MHSHTRRTSAARPRFALIRALRPVSYSGQRTQRDQHDQHDQHDRRDQRDTALISRRRSRALLCAASLVICALSATARQSADTVLYHVDTNTVDAQTFDIDAHLKSLGLKRSLADAESGGAGGFVYNAYLTLEDFSNGWYDENGVIDMSPSLDAAGPTTQQKTAFAWNGGIDNNGIPRRGFKEDWNVFRLWVNVPTESPLVVAFAGSSTFPMILSAGGSNFYQTVTGATVQVQTDLMRIWTGDISDKLYTFGFDSFLTIGHAAYHQNLIFLDGEDQVANFESGCEAGMTGDNIGVILLNLTLAPFATPDPDGGYRMLLGQFAVRKGYEFSGQAVVSMVNEGGSTQTITWSSLTGTSVGELYSIAPLGNARLTIDGTNVSVDNIGDTGSDGMAVNFDLSGTQVSTEGYGVAVEEIDIVSADDDAAFIARCTLDNCFSTLFDPIMSIGKQTELGLVIGTVIFPICDAVLMELWKEGHLVGSWIVPDGNVFHVVDAVPGTASTPNRVACIGSELRLYYGQPHDFRVLMVDTTFNGDEIRLRPTECYGSLTEVDAGPPAVRQLSIRMKNIPQFDATSGTFDPMCAGDVFPPGGNGERNIDDFIAVLNQLGSCPGCPEDVTPVAQPNGDVNVDDLVVVLNGFGPCSAL
jgi:hypothetical protein